MKKLLFFFMSFLVCCNSFAQTPIYDFDREYDIVTDADTFYFFSTPKPCINPVPFTGALLGTMLQQYVPTDTMTVYGVAIPLSNLRGYPIYDNVSDYQALLTTRGPSSRTTAFTTFYSMYVVDSVTLNRSHPRFCWFRYEDSCDKTKVLTVPCYEFYFDTPGQVNQMVDTFYVGRFAGSYYYTIAPEDRFVPQEYGGEYDPSIPSTLYYNGMGYDGEWYDYFTQQSGSNDVKRWGVYFPIIGFRCKPMRSYWLDAFNGTNAVVRWRSDGQDTLFNVRLVGEDGSDTTIVTTDTIAVFTHLSDSVRYNVTLRKQCRYCTSNYDTTLYSDWTPALWFGTTIPRVVTHTVTATSADYGMGTVIGGGEYRDSSMVTLTAYSFGGYRFDAWNDGSTDNPLQFLVTRDTSFTAYFSEAGGVGVQLLEGEDFLLRPNPARGIVQVQLPPEALGGQLAICDLAGRELMVRPVEDTAMEVDLATLPSGTYLVKLTTPRGVTTRRLLVEKGK